MIKYITSKDNKFYKDALKLKEAKYRKESGAFLAETFKSLEMALKNKQVLYVFSTKEIEIEEDIPLYIISEDMLKKLSSNVHPEGVVFVNKIRDISQREHNKILYLDEVSDPGNAGTLIRTALAFSYDAVVLSKNSVSIYNEKVINSSKGAIFNIDVFVSDLEQIRKDHTVIASSLSSDSIPLEEVKAPDKFILVVGNESHGIREDIINQADIKCNIPIANIDSLNAAVAGGILMNKIH